MGTDTIWGRDGWGGTMAGWRVQAPLKGKSYSASADGCHSEIRPNVASSDFLFFQRILNARPDFYMEFSQFVNVSN